jgi:hypothetical protein
VLARHPLDLSPEVMQARVKLQADLLSGTISSVGEITRSLVVAIRLTTTYS